jgi:ribonuclease BN (tRNA processing enzyme)
MTQSRRQFLAATAAAAVTALVPTRVFAQRGGTRIVLLGTKGGPTVGISGRSNPSTLLLIDNVPYVVDCGYGVTRQLLNAHVNLERLRYIFITHHHSDHDLEYGPLIYNSWATDKPIKIDAFGPAGLEQMTRDFFEYEKLDIETRMADEGRADPRKSVTAHDLVGEGLVLKNDDVTVTSCLVKHPPIERSYAFRFDTRDRSVVISGDTAYLPKLAEFAKGADVLIHEAMYLPAIDKLVKNATGSTRLRQHLIASHTTTDDVGRIASAAGVKTLVLSHLVPGNDPSITDEMWAVGARKFFNGKIIVGKDLMEI